MTDDHLARATAFLDELHIEGTPDFAKMGAYFTETGTYQPLVPAIAKITGPAAIAAALEHQYRTYYECRCEIHAAAAAGRFVLMERTDHVTLVKGDTLVKSRVAAVFEFADDGRIASWREYWDTGDVMAQMGINASELAAAM
ncbi:limonene-1,2-epoxide hydrolase family protein [Sphingomonas sp. 28-63-12]|uniref:limonene-1,2-epoxide hydrolase family protein n=1 Tax=Sphingomonas sp. 28-63-12 TaxID=1970434 RepID=UPI000BD3B550|nr:MAG: hypothetical protein B7Y47_01455 [Sphingomonas sp. 28-63-12]